MRAISPGLLVGVCIVVLNFGCAGTIPRDARDVNAERDSIVIGRIEGHILAREGEMYDYYNQTSPEWVIDGMELREVNTEEIFKVKLDRSGFFNLMVPPGSYVLQKNRKGQRDFKVKKVEEWEHFKVFPGKLVNLGTYKIETTKKLGSVVTDLMLFFTRTHRSDPGSERETLEWFRGRHPALYEKYRDRVLDYRTVTSPRMS